VARESNGLAGAELRCEFPFRVELPCSGARAGRHGEVLGLVVTGCLDYGFVGRPEHHQTGFTFEVSRKAAAIPGDRCCAIDFLGNDVPAADLRVTLCPFGGF
jgi:hypothetical protein